MAVSFSDKAYCLFLKPVVTRLDYTRYWIKAVRRTTSSYEEIIGPFIVEL